MDGNMRRDYIRSSNGRFFLSETFYSGSIWIDRRDMSILEKELPSKNEFVISCRLSELQKAIYEVKKTKIYRRHDVSIGEFLISFSYLNFLRHF